MRSEQEIREEIEKSRIYLDYWVDNLARDKAYGELNQIPNDEKAITLWENYIGGLKWVLEDTDER